MNLLAETQVQLIELLDIHAKRTADGYRDHRSHSPRQRADTDQGASAPLTSPPFHVCFRGCGTPEYTTSAVVV